MKHKFNKNEFVICIFFFILSFCKGIGLNNSNHIYIALYAICLLFGIIKTINVGMSRNELFSIGVILLIGACDFLFGKETTILFTALSLLFLKNNNITNIIKAIFIGRLISFCLMIILPVLGITEMNYLYFYRNAEYVTRYSFGYGHPNLAHSTFNIIILIWGYLYYDKINFRNILLIELLNAILYYFTYSRTGFYLLAFYLIIVYIIKRSSKIRELIPKILNYAFIGAIALSFALALLYGKSAIVNKINSLLTGRVYFMNYLLTNYSIPLIKTKIYNNVFFDNGYFDLLYNGGLLAFCWFSFFQVKLNNYIKKNNLYKEAILVISLLVYSFTESYYASAIMNVGILFFSYVIYSKNSNDKSKQIN